MFAGSVVLAIVVGFFLPVRYTATSQLLIVQRQASALDAYTAYRAAERSGLNLVQITNSGSFRQRVIDRLPAAQTAAWRQLTEEDRSKQWSNRVTVRLVPDSTILRVSATAPTADQSVQLNAAIDATLTSQYSDYLGGDQGTVITEIDAPAVGNNPSQPDFFILAIIGVVVGFLSTAIYFWHVSREDR